MILRDEAILLILPGEDATIEVPSSSNASLRYHVNPHRMTCTCPDFLKNRIDQPHQTLLRACKHIRGQLAKVPEYELTPFIPLFLSKFTYRHFVLSDSPPMIVTYRRGGTWVNGFAVSSDGTLAEHGYSLLEKRWAYRRAPYAADEMIELMESVRAEVLSGEDLLQPDDVSFAISDERIDIPPDLVDTVHEFYALMLDVLEDDRVTNAEVRSMLKYFGEHSKLLDLPIFRGLTLQFDRALEDGRLVKQEENMLRGYLRKLEPLLG